MKDNLTIIIPAHNEEKIIIKTIKQIQRYVKIPFLLIIVNDHSTDKTELVVKNYAEGFKNIKVINNSIECRGFAGALQTGFEAVKNGVVIPVMADLCDNPTTINRMYRKMYEGWDIVCGSRYIKGGSKKGGPKLQGFLSNYVCKSLHLLTGIPTTDVSNAFKMYRREIIDQVQINLKSGVEASMEITLQAYFNGAKITEVPTSWKGRVIGKSKFKILERSPRYWRIYIWAIENTLRNRLGLRLKVFYN
jgi:glycosyltransferase involved in cell wall biosynthesis